MTSSRPSRGSGLRGRQGGLRGRHRRGLEPGPPSTGGRKQTTPTAAAAADREAGDPAQSTADRSDPAIVGRLWKSRGAPSFFGNSYFGPQVAAALLDTSAPYIQPGASTSIRSSMARPFRDEAGPFSQLWDLLGMLPRQRATVDRLVDLFLRDVTSPVDAVHPSSFRKEYERFYSRKAGFDDVTTVDIRWLALLFIVLAIGTYLDCPRDARPEVQREHEEASLSFFWACRRAIVIAPSFYGESTDLVRAGILVTRYCLFSQRITESWLTVGFASRIAMAQGFHIDGTHWKLPRRVTEARRRLWCHLYLLDRMIALALGRPYCILDNLSATREPENVFLDDFKDDDTSAYRQESLVTNPTPSVLAIFSYRLAKVIGRIQEQTFGLHAASYGQVMRLDAQLIAWKKSLPAYFDMDGPDLSLDQTYPFLKWHRVYLHTAFHFACITLHRPYIWRISVTDQHRYSREVCFASACADLKTRLEHDDNCEPADHYTWCLGAPRLFNSAIILGLLAIQEQPPFPRDLHPVINDLQSFCDKERNEIWANDFRLAEVDVVELCIDRLKRRAGGWEADGLRRQQQQQQQYSTGGSHDQEPQQQRQRQGDKGNESVQFNPVTQSSDGTCSQSFSSALAEGAPQPLWQPLFRDESAPAWDMNDRWFGPISDGTMPIRPGEAFSEGFAFPGPTDLGTWEDMIDSIARQSSGQVLPG
ncbi:hypothetical protein N7474_011252 [Penicillium riverlandense]|uniref:uncharacterized protein n=1 Tax=Penicillium riverlandense TaxID=1903569 RepID=UPI002549B360|nr:uncharacterized protein N7474_011252 [Penicillium riverlandense]KAJ5805365.1 hypothetical protein N7474_011252 [Penicillium riverlandense]